MIPETILWLSLNLYHEARGEPEISQKAVAHVTLNRARESGRSVQEVIKDHGQFSWQLDRRKRNAQPWKIDPKTFARCGMNAIKALRGPDFTKGSTHFHETRSKPKWARKLKSTGRFGKFTFYKELKHARNI
jgi:N-acetylmuramoyl-L-alanine amidase